MRKLLSLLIVTTLTFVSFVFPALAVDGTVVAINQEGESFGSLEDAVTETFGDWGRGEVTLVQNYTMVSDLIIPSEITVIIPTGANANDTEYGNNIVGGGSGLNAYSELTIPVGITLTVEGKLLVAGNQQSTQPKTGCLTGDHGQVIVNGALDVESGGKLYARGIVSGDGDVTAESGSEVYQLFGIRDWRGGAKTLSAYNKKVFPFALYEVKNISARTVYQHGSALYARYFIHIGSKNYSDNVAILGGSGSKAALEFTGAGGVGKEVIMTCVGENYKVVVKDALTTGNISITIADPIFTFLPITISASNMVGPFGYNMDVDIENSGSIDVTNKLRILPGCDFNVKNGGALNISAGGALYFYKHDDFLDKYVFRQPTGACLIPSGDATLTVNGTFTNGGVVASSDIALSNLIGGFSADGNTYKIKEYIQSSDTTEEVTFYGASFTPPN